jgi:hypothetical protein
VRLMVRLFVTAVLLLHAGLQKTLDSLKKAMYHSPFLSITIYLLMARQLWIIELFVGRHPLV